MMLHYFLDRWLKYITTSYRSDIQTHRDRTIVFKNEPSNGFFGATKTYSTHITHFCDDIHHMKVFYQTYVRHLNTYVVTVSTYEGYLPNIR